MDGMNFDLASFNRARAAKGLPEMTAEEFYGEEDKSQAKLLTAKQRAKKKKKRKMRKDSQRKNRFK